MTENNQSNLIKFFLISIGFTWLFWIPDGLGKRDILPSSILTNLGFFGAFGPLVAAIIMVNREGGKEGIKKLFQKGVDKSFPSNLWIPILFLFPVLIMISYFIAIQIDQATPVSEAEGMYMYLPFIFFTVLFTSGPFQEEFGWRGYAQPKLQQKFTPFTSSLILGFIWAFWHYPQFLVPKELTGMFYITPIWSFTLTVMVATFIYTWIYNKTNGSVLAALILHTMMNLFFWIFPVLYTEWGYLIVLIIFSTVAFIIVLFDKKTFFARNSDQ